MHLLKVALLISLATFSAPLSIVPYLQCRPLVSSLEFVTFRFYCNGNSIGSVCFIFCPRGQTHYGIRQTRCSHTGEWQPSRQTTPTGCRSESSQCIPFSEPVQFLYSCTNGNYVDSVCTIYCADGYQLNDGGLTQTVCGANRHWIYSPSQTRCIPVPTECPPLPTNVVYTSSCTDGRNAGSVCHFQCPANQVMSGTSHSTCGRDGQWSPHIDIQCSVPCELDDITPCFAPPCLTARCPAFPNAVCQDNYCGGCNFKFFVNGVEKSREECIVQDPSCPTNVRCADVCGARTCSNHVNAVCKMCGCNPRFYHFQTLAQVTCTVINQCPPLPTNVVYTSSCTDGRNSGSVCHFQCPANQVMSGTSHSTCGRYGQWSPRIDTQCSVQCSPLQPQASCSEIPCERARCPAFPDAVCQNNYCGGCNFKFFVNGVEKTRYQCLPNDCLVPEPTPTDPYFGDICLDLCMVLCPNHRDALCRPCGCTRRMYDYTTLQLLNC